MSNLVNFRIDISATSGLMKMLKNAPKGYGAYAATSKVADKVLAEIKKGGKGVSYSDGPSGGAPISIPGKKNYVIGSKGGKARQFPRGYLSQSHFKGGRKGNSITIMSNAPYTHSIINGGVTPTGGIYPGNKYPERVLKKVSADLSYSGFYNQVLREHFGLSASEGYYPGTYLGNKDLV